MTTTRQTKEQELSSTRKALHMKLSAPRTQRPDLEQKGHDNKNSMKQETHYLITKDQPNSPPMNYS